MNAERQLQITFLATAENGSEATIWKALLDGEGIPSWIRTENTLTILQEPLPFTYSVDFYTPAERLDEARSLLGIRPRRRTYFRPPKPGTAAVSWVLLAGIATSFAVAVAEYLGWLR